MRRYAILIAVTIALISPTPASAQTTPKPVTPPPSQDDQLRILLALGDATGCAKLLGLTQALPTQEDVKAALDGLGPKIGNELRAICGPSAVSSASSLGGGISSAQGSKLSTQIRPRPRLLSPRPAGTAKPTRAVGMNFFQDGSSSALAFDDEVAPGVSVFGGIDLDRRTRVETKYESGYEAHSTGLSGGVSYQSGRTLVGGWAGKGQQSADFTRFGILLDKPDAITAATFATPGVVKTVCGGLSTAGGFEDRSTSFGGFVGSRGGPAFAEAGVVWSRLEHDYSRSVCAIESGAGIVFNKNTGELSSGGLVADGGTLIDDIYAGTIKGTRITHEARFSFGVGSALGNGQWAFTPRADLTVRTASSDPYIETGKSTVANDVRSNLDSPEHPDVVHRTLGGPVGFELAFEDQTRTSILLESGGEVSVRFGSIIPHAAGYWRHEFKNSYYLVTARLAQDLRTTPTEFTFGNDPFDRDSLLFRFGCTVLAGKRGAAKFELTKAARDALFVGSRSFTAQALVQF